MIFEILNRINPFKSKKVETEEEELLRNYLDNNRVREENRIRLLRSDLLDDEFNAFSCSTIEVEPIERDNEMDLQRFNIKRNNALFLNELNEIKVEFDLIFVSLVDKISCDSFCSLSSSSVSIPHIENSLYNSPTGDTFRYELSISYPIYTIVEDFTKTLSEMSEDMLDIEAYNKYIKTKYPESYSSIKTQIFEKTTKISLFIDVKSNDNVYISLNYKPDVICPQDRVRWYQSK